MKGFSFICHKYHLGSRSFFPTLSFASFLILLMLQMIETVVLFSTAILLKVSPILTI